VAFLGPALLLDDDEAMAVTLGLILAASHGLSDTADSSMRAFSKVVALLPARLRPRLESLAPFREDALLLAERNVLRARDRLNELEAKRAGMPALRAMPMNREWKSVQLP